MVATLLAFVLTFEGIYHFGQDGISAWGTGLLTPYNLFFMFAFLFYKYYDLFWDLLHKSIFLSALGLILIAISYLIRQNARPKLLMPTEVDLEN